MRKSNTSIFQIYLGFFSFYAWFLVTHWMKCRYMGCAYSRNSKILEIRLFRTIFELITSIFWNIQLLKWWINQRASAQFTCTLHVILFHDSTICFFFLFRLIHLKLCVLIINMCIVHVDKMELYLHKTNKLQQIIQNWISIPFFVCFSPFAE